MTGPGNEMPERAADGGHFRASQADRERAIEVVKTAFAEGRLTKDAFDLRVSQALAARTYAELAAVTRDLPVGSAAARAAAARPSSTPARTLAKAAGRAGVCMLAAFVMVGIVALTNGENQAAIFLAFFSVVAAVIASSGLLGYGVVDAWREHRSCGTMPPRAGRNGTGLESKSLESKGLGGGQPSSDGRDPGRPGDHRDQALFDRYSRRPRRGRWHAAGTGARTQRNTRPVLGAL